jgi:hypothetical protein
MVGSLMFVIVLCFASRLAYSMADGMPVAFIYDN